MAVNANNIREAMVSPAFTAPYGTGKRLHELLTPAEVHAVYEDALRCKCGRVREVITITHDELVVKCPGCGK